MSPFKILIFILILLIIQLQYRLWYGDGSVQQVQEYQQRLDAINKVVKEKKERNEALLTDVKNLTDLGSEDDAIEEKARFELGMIEEGETFFQIIE